MRVAVGNSANRCGKEHAAGTNQRKAGRRARIVAIAALKLRSRLLAVGLGGSDKLWRWNSSDKRTVTLKWGGHQYPFAISVPTNV